MVCRRHHHRDPGSIPGASPFGICGRRRSTGPGYLPVLQLSHGSIIPSMLHTLQAFHQLSASLNITLD